MALDWACSLGLIDCFGIHLGQPCYLSSDLLSIASYVFILLQYCQPTQVHDENIFSVESIDMLDLVIIHSNKGT